MKQLIKNEKGITFEYDFNLNPMEQPLLTGSFNDFGKGFNATDFIEDEKINCTNYEKLIDIKFDEKIDKNDQWDYVASIASGIICGIIDIFYVKGFSLKNAETWGAKEIESFVLSFAKSKGFKGKELKDAIKHLEKLYSFPADALTPDFGGGLQHHLRDFCHHPSPVGLVFSILSQFTHKGFGTDTNGNFIIRDIPDDKFIGNTFEEKIFYGTIIWFFHLISDMAGSSTGLGNGTGIPGILLSALKEISTLPIIKDINIKYQDDEIELSLFISKLFNGTYFKGKTIKDGIKFDLRTELGVLKELTIQTIPVIINECLVRSLFSIRRFYLEIKEKEINRLSDLNKVEYIKILPFKNVALNRMITVSSGIFEIIDLGGAAALAAVKSKGNKALFAKEFLIRINIPGIVRFGLACSAEIETLKQKEALKNYNNVKGIPELKEMTLKGNQIKILYSLEILKCKKDIIKTKNMVDKTFKKIWLDKWEELIAKELKETIDYFIDGQENISSLINVEMESNTDNSWMDIVTLECLLFKPYYALGIDEDEKFKKLKCKIDFNETLSSMNIGYSKETIKGIIKLYDKYNNELTNKARNRIVGGIAVAGLTALTGGMFYVFAPSIAVVLVGGSFVGLSGAALTSASLAMLGGGALAVGGLGMAGGTMILAGGGALIGLSVGGFAATASALLMSNSKYTLNECSKLLTFTIKNILSKEGDEEFIKKLINQLRKQSNNIVNSINDLPNDLENRKKVIAEIKKSSGYLEKTANILEKEISKTSQIEDHPSEQESQKELSSKGKKDRIIPFDIKIKKFALKIKPKEYGKLNQPLPKEIPNPKQGCGLHTSSCKALVFSWIVPSSNAMNYDSVDKTIKLFRNQANDNCGIIECKNGTTKNGYKYIYNLWKMRADMGKGTIPDISYNLNINIKVEDDDYFINSNFSEEGVTGMRDSCGFLIFQQLLKKEHPNENFTTKELLEKFNIDPYDNKNRKGFLMNISEHEAYDEMFPSHPLSEARKYIKWIIENN